MEDRSSAPGIPGLFLIPAGSHIECAFIMIIRLVNLSHKKEEAGCNEETWGLDEAVRRAGSYEAVRKVRTKE